LSGDTPYHEIRGSVEIFGKSHISELVQARRTRKWHVSMVLCVSIKGHFGESEFCLI
jgi:hypothetical protein